LDLGDYLWKKRLLLIFSPSESYSDYKIQKEELDRQIAEVEDRDLLVFEILDAKVDHTASFTVSHEYGESLRQRFGVKTGQFTIILLGKDGWEKLRGTKYIPAEDIFSLIDTSFSVSKVEHADWLVYYVVATKNKLNIMNYHSACSTSTIFTHN